MSDAARLKSLFASDDLSWLITALRRRFENGTWRANGTVGLKAPTPQQRQACDRLLGRKPSSGKALTIRIDQLEKVLVEGELASDLREAVEVVSGPLVDRHGQQQQIEEAWRSLFERFHPVMANRAPALAWYEQVWNRGLLRRLSRQSVEQAEQLLEQAVRVVERLPSQGISLAELAAACCGDSHALDPGQPVGTLTVRAAASIGNVQLRPKASSRRRAWDAVGVICDELSAPVLILNLPATGLGLSAQLMQLSAAAGEPCRMTARQLLRHPPAFKRGLPDCDIFVCENAAVVAAAAQHYGVLARPLICIDGQPTTAANILLQLLRKAGFVLHYHGDFDWGGIRIANRVIGDHQARPWRMSCGDYLTAVALGGRELKGNATTASWDRALSATMAEKKVAIHEERVLPMLLGDLHMEHRSKDGPGTGRGMLP